MKGFLQYKAFVFDLDGTLINSERYHTDGFAEAIYRLTGYEITDEERMEFFAGHTRSVYPVLAERHGLTVPVDEVLELKRRLVDENFKADPIPGAIDFVRKWKDRKQYAVASNSTTDFVRQALHELGLGTFFPVICGGDLVVHKKPHPESYLLTARKLNVSPEEVLVFEDTVNGARSALDAGCDCLFIETGAPRDLDSVPAEALRTNWNRLLEIEE